MTARDERDRAAPAEIPYLGRRRTELRDVPDDTLVAAYETARDVREPDGAGATVYPNVRHLFATPFEREKDAREARAAAAAPGIPEMQAWYESAARESCVWWLDHHRGARHAIKSCMFCGVCTAQCPAAQYYDEYNPRAIMDVALSRDEARLVELLRSDLLWYCGQCGSCRPKCARQNNVMALVSSLRLLSQLKGYHLVGVRGRQQYAARHLWGGNFWNRGLSLYFRNAAPEAHPDFGPRFARYFAEAEAQGVRLGACPDREGGFGGRKLDPRTLAELRACVHQGGTLALWNRLEAWAEAHAGQLGIDLDEYHDRVRREG